MVCLLCTYCVLILTLTASSSRSLDRQHTTKIYEDLLPPFSSLTNDEDREKKAECRSPGTYILVVNAASFDKAEGYENSSSDAHVRRPEASNDPSSEDGICNNDDTHNDEDISYSGDPDIVILKVFEDDSQKLQFPGSAISRRPSSASCSVTSSATAAHGPEISRFAYNKTPLMRMAVHDGRDCSLVFHYKTFVHRHLAQAHRDSLGTSLETGTLSAPDVFERHAADFLPVGAISTFHPNYTSPHWDHT